ncbi:hypothetical protein JOD69_001684 [Methylocaldum sp. RMAD-M]|jgi:hypothetical protein|nr:hypothetical protein [Methylocaldum sp. RMAD-M]
MIHSEDNQAGVDRLAKNMPSLAHLEGSLRAKRDLGKFLGVHVQPSGRARQIADGYVRLVEKAILEYEASRDQLLRFLADGTADCEYRAQDHFESCVQSLHRAIEYLERLRGFGYRREDGQPLVPKPRDLEVLRKHVRAKVRGMRDAAEHLDCDILDGRYPMNAQVGIHLGWDTATLGSHSISYVEVTRWLTQLHEYAGLLSRVHVVVGQKVK